MFGDVKWMLLKHSDLRKVNAANCRIKNQQLVDKQRVAFHANCPVLKKVYQKRVNL